LVLGDLEFCSRINRAKSQALIGGAIGSPKNGCRNFNGFGKVGWDDPGCKSLDLEYHNIDPTRGLFFSVTPGKRRRRMEQQLSNPPTATRVPAREHARLRARPRRRLFSRSPSTYVINWDSIAHDSRDFLSWAILETYNTEVDQIPAKRAPRSRIKTQHE